MEGFNKRIIGKLIVLKIYQEELSVVLIIEKEN